VTDIQKTKQNAVSPTILRILAGAGALILLSSSGAALDLNDTESLDYYPSNQLEFRVQPDGTIQPRGDIELSGNNIDTSGNTITLRDSTNNQDILRAEEGGRVYVPNGSVSIGSGQSKRDLFVLDESTSAAGALKPGPVLVQTSEQYAAEFQTSAEFAGFLQRTRSSSGTPFVQFASGNSVGWTVQSNNGQRFQIRQGNAAGTPKLGIKQDGEVLIQNSNLDVSGNNITSIDTLKFEEGTSINGNVSIEGNIDTTGDIDLKDNNLLDANKVEANRIIDPEDERIDTDSSLDFNGNGDIISVNNINVGSITSNNGNGDIQFNQGFNVDGSSGGDGGVTLSGSGGLDVDAAGGDNQQNGGDSLRLNGNINFDGGNTNTPVLRTPGGGSGSLRIYDDANTQDIAQFQEGGNVNIPSGSLNINSPGNNGGALDIGGDTNADGTVTSDATTGFRLTGGGAGESTEIVTRNSGDSFIRVFQNGAKEDARFGLEDSSGTIVDLQARQGTIGPRNANFRLNSGYGIENGAGTKAINIDSRADVEVPNGAVNISQGSGIGDLSGNERISIEGNTVVRGKGGARVAVSTNSVDIRSSTNSRDVIIGGGGTEFARFSPNGNQDTEFVSGDVEVLNGNNIEMFNGDVDLRGGKIVDTTGSDTVRVGDADSNTVRIDAGGSGDAVVSSGDGGSSSTERLRVTSSGGEADVDVSNSDVDLQGNSVTSSAGEVCIGDQCA
jgi:hypothetical protein